MHPDARDASVAALAHDLFGSVRPGDDHDAVDTTRNRFHVWIAALVLERFHMRIDRKDFVSSGLEAVEDQVSDGMATVVVRYASHRDALLSQELLDFVVECLHIHFSSSTRFIKNVATHVFLSNSEVARANPKGRSSGCPCDAAGPKQDGQRRNRQHV